MDSLRHDLFISHGKTLGSPDVNQCDLRLFFKYSLQQCRAMEETAAGADGLATSLSNEDMMIF